MIKDLVCLMSGVLMTTCYLMCGIPQIIKTIKTKSVKDISVWSLSLAAAGHTFASIYGTFGHNNFWTFVCYFGGLSTAFTMLVLWYIYKK